MCGRYTLSAGESEILERFNVDDVFMETRLTPRFNIAPTQDIVVILSQDGKRVLTAYKWGLIPFWVKDLAQARPMINARAETLPEKPFFKTALSRRRCIIPADGFFEWQSKADSKTKTPMWIHLSRQGLLDNGQNVAEHSPVLFGFAGLYDKWKRPDGTLLETCTIITTSANQAISPVHERMPVILSKGAESVWLNATIQDPQELMQVLHACPDNIIQMHPVSARVNKPAAQGQDLIEPCVNDDVEAAKEAKPRTRSKSKAAPKGEQYQQITLPGLNLPESD
ncbi:MAG: Abasic site processing protein [Cyanobacteriota bacterium erpe_2018_sw_39hr_WHONDRS-SW48-000098_B_bin.30]|nr:SOS response-associated peptidase [Candidatus Obscuribacter sp.]MDQ5967317.1 Abasic site processing protein [Cyanobacteriota bacterium erpe_2018_sw_39hr_WHONDRS-SW48-000098_B_bin.30]